MRRGSISSNSIHPRVSIITINYRQPELTCLFLNSANQLVYNNLEIILVDNGALKSNESYFKSKFPEITYLYSGVNLGFAGANNLGMSKANGDYFFIVNNDTVLSPDLITNLLRVFSEELKVGAVSPKIKYFDMPEVIQYAGFTKLNWFTGRNRMLGDNEIDVGQYDKRKPTSYAHGAAMMVKKEVFVNVGGFYEQFFMYYEELDWSQRMISAGYSIYYEPKGEVLHKVSMSIGKENPIKSYYLIRNRILFMRRTYSTAKLLGFFCYLVFITIPISLIRYLSKGKFEEIKNFFKGILWNLINFQTSKLKKL